MTQRLLSLGVSRDDVGLPGFAAYFKQNSDEEREHATKLMVQQSRRGGRVQLKVG
jgi:ferritin heavy chain